MQNLLTDEKLLRHIEYANTILIALATLGAWFLFSGKMALGVFIGGAIATLSFQVLKWQVKRAFQVPGKVPRKRGFFLTYYLRFLGTLFLIFTVIYYGWANPVAFLVGLSTIPVSMVLVGVKEFMVILAQKGGR